MHALLSLPCAVVGRPLFGNQWLALLAILAGIAVFLVVVAAVGRWLAATHPEPAPRAVSTPPAPVVQEPTPEVLAVIAAAVATTLGASARVTSVEIVPPHAPNVESLMVQWSLEGRRQIYTSHKVR
jgi:hypothetical protein